MRGTRHTFIFKEIHDFRTPIIVPPAYIDKLREEKIITEATRKQALQGKEIMALGYRVVADKKLPTKLRNNGRN